MAISRVFALTAGLLSVAGCASLEPGAYFHAPEAHTDGSVSINGGSTAASVSLAASKLRDGGFTITRMDTGRGTLTASTSNRAFIDCGQVRQTALGNTAYFDGNAKLAVIYTNQDPIEFQTREVSLRTTVNLEVSGNNASISEVHDVTIVWRSADKKRATSETLRVSGSELVRFRDITACTSSGRTAAILSSG